MKFFLALFLSMLFVGPAANAEQFKDVSNDHWARPAVDALAAEGILKGYPDNSYRGDKPVTRYELAVALARFAEVITQSAKPLTNPAKAISTPQKEISPDSNPQKYLQSNGFLPANSELLKDSSKPVTAAQLADALASMSARIIELRTPVAAEESNLPTPAPTDNTPTH